MHYSAGWLRRMVAWAAAVVVVVWSAASAVPVAHASVAGFTSVQSADGWVEVNGDARTDFCHIDGGGLRCLVVTESGVLGSFRSGTIDLGYWQGRAWTDVTGDGLGDYCRVVGGMSKMVQCTAVQGSRFGSTFTSGTLDPGYDAGRAWADVNGDGRSDYCRVVGSWDKRVKCTLSTGDGFGAEISSSWLDPGWDAGRAWVDVNADAKADFCRIVNNAQVQCTLSTGGGFGSSFSSQPIDGGYDETRRWADVNADGRADFCRVVNQDLTSRWGYLRCSQSTGTQFPSSRQVGSTKLETGRWYTAQWADVTGDGRDDYCRITSANYIARCTTTVIPDAFGNAFGETISHPSIDPLAWHGFVDINGDGKADHGVALKDRVIVTLSNGNGWAPSQTFTIPPPRIL